MEEISDSTSAALRADKLYNRASQHMRSVHTSLHALCNELRKK